MEITVKNSVQLDHNSGTVVLASLVVNNPDLFAVLSTQPPATHEQMVLDVLAVGGAAMRRVQTTVDLDLVEKRFGGLSANFERSLTAFEKKALETMTSRFSPTENGSYTKHIADVVSTARKDVQSWTTDLSKCAKDLLDPEKKSSAVGQLEKLVQTANERFAKMFDPEARGSYAARLNDQLTAVFGENGRPGALGALMKDSLQPVLKDLQEIKEKVEARKAAEQVVAISTLKGRPFEDEIHCQLSLLAQPYGDDVTAVGNSGSRSGDFIVTLAGSGRRLVVEARDRRVSSLPAIKGELQTQKKAREADIAIYVASGREMLPQHVGEFQIYGDQIITTSNYLLIAYRIARLITTMQAPAGQLDAGALRGIFIRVKDAISTLRNVKSKASQIRNLADGVHEDATSAETRVIELLREAEGMLNQAALNPGAAA
jgi:hypothetical protein